MDVLARVLAIQYNSVLEAPAFNADRSGQIVALPLLLGVSSARGITFYAFSGNLIVFLQREMENVNVAVLRSANIIDADFFRLQRESF